MDPEVVQSHVVWARPTPRSQPQVFQHWYFEGSNVHLWLSFFSALEIVPAVSPVILASHSAACLELAASTSSERHKTILPALYLPTTFCRILSGVSRPRAQAQGECARGGLSHRVQG